MQVLKTDQFFLSIVRNKNGHTYLLLGVKTYLNKDDQNKNYPKIRILARLGKGLFFNESDNQCLKWYSVYFGGTIDSVLFDEGIQLKTTLVNSYQYRAYDISYEQLIEFYKLIRVITISQSEKYNPKRDETLYDRWPKIFNPKVYIIESENDGNISFRKDSVLNSNSSASENISGFSETLNSILTFNAWNTCRTSAIRIFEQILGFMPNVSSLFFISPGYETSFDETGAPKLDNFYILPPPPHIYKNLSPQQKRVLESLYQRLESLPYLNPNSEKTNRKFEALKKIYLDLAPKENLSIDSLLASINAFEHDNQQALFQHRSNDFNFFQSTKTEKLFTTIKRDLESLHCC